MKVTLKSEPLFIPVVVTLETQEEVDIIYNLSGKIAGTGKVRKATNTIRESLEPYVSTVYFDYFDGTLTISPW